MITEGQEDYQEKYKQYIIDHKRRVKQFADWMKENLPEIFNEPGLDDFDELIQEHDDSKFSEEEFDAYAQKFYK
jgi:glutamate synthase domain-containing protein 2